jgi:hypothetical protein
MLLMNLCNEASRRVCELDNHQMNARDYVPYMCIIATTGATCGADWHMFL